MLNNKKTIHYLDTSAMRAFGGGRLTWCDKIVYSDAIVGTLSRVTCKRCTARALAADPSALTPLL